MHAALIVLVSSACVGHAAAFTPITGHLDRASAAGVASPRASARMEKLSELEALATKLNPAIGFWDPLSLASIGELEYGALWGPPRTTEYLGGSQEAWIGFLRHAEIKHGRVAMAAFVGYVVQANNIHFPWFSDESAAGSPPEQWDALPSNIKGAFFLSIFLLEWLGESTYMHEALGEKHYMRGGKPGFFPSLKDAYLENPVTKGPLPEAIPVDLWDPLGNMKELTPEQKERGRLIEINNGRLAMIGIMAFLAESKIPGSVPALARLDIKPYAGEVMAPFSEANIDLPFVAEMLKVKVVQ